MNRKTLIAVSALGILLIASLALNVVVSQRGRSFYLQLQATRLDPFGLKTYPSSIETRHGPIIVFCGDSRAEQWPAPDQLKNATVINRGIGNQTTAQVLGRFQQHVASLKPDVVVLQVGVNDLKTLPLFPNRKEAIIQDCKANIARLVGDSLTSGARVIVTTIFPLGKVPIERKPFWSDDVAAAIIEVNGYLKTLASEHVTVFDTGQLLTDRQGLINPSYSHDLLHLTPEGYAALNRSLSDFLLP